MNSFLIGAVVPIVAMQTILHEGELMNKLREKWATSGLLGKSLMATGGLAALAGLGAGAYGLYNYANTPSEPVSEPAEEETPVETLVPEQKTETESKLKTVKIDKEEQITPENNENAKMIEKENVKRIAPISQPMSPEESIKAEQIRRKVIKLDGTKVGGEIYRANPKNIMVQDPYTGKLMMQISKD